MSSPLNLSSGYYFHLTIDGLPLGPITEVSEFKFEQDTKAQRVRVGKQTAIVNIPTGEKAPPEITVTCMYTGSDAIFQWCQLGKANHVAAYRHGALTHYDASFTNAMKTWNFHNAFGKNYSLSAVSMDGGKPQTEKFTIVFMDLA